MNKIHNNNINNNIGTSGLGDSNYSITTDEFEQQSLNNSSNNISSVGDSSSDNGNNHHDSNKHHQQEKEQQSKELPLHRFFKPPHFIRDPKAQRMLSLIVGIITIITSGTIYGFSIISNTVRDDLDYDQTEIGLAISLGDVGVYLGVTVGYFFDRLGPFYTSLLGMSCYLLGYMGMWGILNGTVLNSPILLAVFLFIVGQGSYASFNSTLVPNVHNFKVEHRGKISGIFVGMFALSAAIFGFIYKGTYGKTKDVQGYILFLAIFLAAVSLVSAYFVRAVKIEGVVEPELECDRLEREKRERESSSLKSSSEDSVLDSSVYNGTYSVKKVDEESNLGDSSSSSCNKIVVGDKDSSINKGKIIFTNIPYDNNNSSSNSNNNNSNDEYDNSNNNSFNNSNNNNYNSNHPHHNHKNYNSDKSYLLLNKYEDIESSTSSTLASDLDLANPNYLDGKRDISGIQLFKNVEFWSLFICYFFCGGGSLMFLNNIGVMCESLNESDDVQSNLVIIFSVGNCIGRVGMGFITDLISKKLSKFWCVVLSSSLIAITHLITSFLLHPMLYPATVLTGIGYGAMVSIMVSLAFVRFGARRFGFNFGVLAISSAAAALIFSTFSGKIYDHLAAQSPDGVCYGNHCFQLSHIISFVTNAVCIVLGLFLVYYNKKLLLKRKN